MLNPFKRNKEDVVFNMFKERLEKKGLTIKSIDEEDFIYIDIGESDLKISLENVRLNYKRDSDETHIDDLIDVIISHSFKIDDWEKIKDKIYIQFIPNDFDFGNTVNEKVTNEFSKAFTLSLNNGYSFITNDDLCDWNISLKDLQDQADFNLGILLDKVKIELEDIDGHKLGMINIDEVSLKSSCLFSLKIKDLVKDNIGYPFYAVIPVRDFCYIFSEEDFEYFSQRLGSVVLDEYNNSGYAITTEILRFSESGVEAIGKY
ncbi:hypothetical protein HNP37_003950 [Flavobacterium nitrogenifigens]|uniref:Uncharacterized protein n=2 Tax=Flavobacterium TaxID=237 RepID=A0A7W7N8F0_9FLAO|nr:MULTISPECIES: hypothetical protein [Flavobacterium]MBB4803870.1 hypothetical protein [Flavobacterium nitrogenifigens]MBB6388978.1 hypothetical protein [Flavobacterium notoginsengisoli]